MNKTAVLLGIVILAVLVLGGAYALRPATTAPQAAPQAGQQQTGPTNPNPTTTPATMNEVDLTDNGFSPATITVKKGTTVNFVNKSSGPMWVASNPHPVHTDYPGFDEKQTADSYSFTFDKVGTWGFHNHPTPSVKGTVVVAP